MCTVEVGREAFLLLLLLLLLLQAEAAASVHPTVFALKGLVCYAVVVKQALMKGGLS